MRILILGDEEKAIYHPLGRVSGGIVKVFGEAGECEVSVDYRSMEKERLREYDVVLSYIDNYTDEGGFGDKLASYIEGGGKVLVLHNGIITPDNSRLERLYGGNFITHPPYCELRYYEGEELLCSMEEEPYMLRQADEGNDIFLWYEMDGERYPAGWSRNAGRGRVCFLAPGHDERTTERKEFQYMLRKALGILLDGGAG